MLASGAGKRFAEVGYDKPKPLIDIGGRPMIEIAAKNVGIDGRYIYVLQRQHWLDYESTLAESFNKVSDDWDVVFVDGITDGAARSALLAKTLINNKEPLLVVNSDQFVCYDVKLFQKRIEAGFFHSVILTFKANEPKWSYVGFDESGYVNRVAEKVKISSTATVGYYGFNRGKDFVRAAEDMVLANDTFNNEFYVAPSINYLIKSGGLVDSFPAKWMYGLGDPESLEMFKEDFRGLV